MNLTWGEETKIRAVMYRVESIVVDKSEVFEENPLEAYTGGLEKLHQKWPQKSMKFFPRRWSFSNDGEVFPTMMKFFFLTSEKCYLCWNNFELQRKRNF